MCRCRSSAIRSALSASIPCNCPNNALTESYSNRPRNISASKNRQAGPAPRKKGNTMKKFIALTLITVGMAMPVRAQWIVYDPTSNIQQIIDTAQEIAKYVEMIENQVQQIETLKNQLN